MKITRAAADIFIYRVMSENSEDKDLIKNGYMLLGDAFRRCNYLASAEGLIIGHIVRKNLRNYLPNGPIVNIINFSLVSVEILVNLVDDLVGFQLNFMGL